VSVYDFDNDYTDHNSADNDSLLDAYEDFDDVVEKLFDDFAECNSIIITFFKM
jgi:hypothetical protein